MHDAELIEEFCRIQQKLERLERGCDDAWAMLQKSSISFEEGITLAEAIELVIQELRHGAGADHEPL